MDRTGRGSDAVIAINATTYQERTRAEGQDLRETAVLMAGGDPTNQRHLALAKRGVPAAWAHAPLSYLVRAIAESDATTRALEAERRALLIRLAPCTVQDMEGGWGPDQSARLEALDAILDGPRS